MPPKPPSRPAPAMGVKDGVRKDVDASKEDNDSGYNPNGVGMAWTHKFLNLKPWHPMSFRNREKVYKAEQQQYESDVRKQRGQKEWAAEQEYLKTISMLSAEEQEKYKQRQSVSWLYQKPPGFDTAKAHPPQTNDDNKNKNDDDNKNKNDGGNQQEQPSTSAPASNGNKNKDRRRQGGNYLSKVVSGVQAVVVQQRHNFELKQQHRGAGMNLSPPRGDCDPTAENQTFVIGEYDSDEEERAYRIAMMSEDEKRKIEKERKKENKKRAREEWEIKKAAERQRLQEAKEFLRTAGIKVPDSSSSDDDDDDDDSREEEDSDYRSRQRRRKEKKRQR